MAVPWLAAVPCAARAAAPGPGTFLLHELFCPTWQGWLQPGRGVQPFPGTALSQCGEGAGLGEAVCPC